MTASACDRDSSTGQADVYDLKNLTNVKFWGFAAFDAAANRKRLGVEGDVSVRPPGPLISSEPAREVLWLVRVEAVSERERLFLELAPATVDEGE